jgi:hypothetical protein
MARPTGIVARHSRSCRSRDGGRCSCDVVYEAWVWVASDGKKASKRFATEKEARSWRASATTAVERHELRAHRSPILREAAERWLEQAEAGEIRNKSRATYKPSALRGYRHDLETYVFPDIGARRLSSVTRHDVQSLVERLIGDDYSASKVRNVVVALKAVWRRQLRLGLAQVDPTVGLELPAPGPAREQADEPAVFEELVAVLNDEHRRCGRRRSAPASDGASSAGSSGRTSTSTRTGREARSTSFAAGTTRRARSRRRAKRARVSSRSRRTCASSCSSTRHAPAVGRGSCSGRPRPRCSPDQHSPSGASGVEGGEHQAGRERAPGARAGRVARVPARVEDVAQGGRCAAGASGRVRRPRRPFGRRLLRAHEPGGS